MTKPVGINFMEYSPSIDFLIHKLNLAKAEGATHVDIKIDAFEGADSIQQAFDAGLHLDLNSVELIVK